MTTAATKPREFWDHPYTRFLPIRGKLALYYALCYDHAGQQIIAEDMAAATGIELSECQDWIDQFTEDDILNCDK